MNINLEEGENVIFLDQFWENWGHEPAWSTPSCCEVYHNLWTKVCNLPMFENQVQEQNEKKTMVTTTTTTSTTPTLLLLLLLLLLLATSLFSCQKTYTKTGSFVNWIHRERDGERQREMLTILPRLLASSIFVSRSCLLFTICTLPWSPAMVGSKTTKVHTPRSPASFPSSSLLFCFGCCYIPWD